MKDGGIVSCYGMTAGGEVNIGMGFVLKNLEFKGAYDEGESLKVGMMIRKDHADFAVGP